MGTKTNTAATAIVKDPVPYGDAKDRSLAPQGEYEIQDCEAWVAFCQCDGTCDFTLSHDAFAQHVAEGRIAVNV
jgi:hypothetical protein